MSSDSLRGGVPGREAAAAGTAEAATPGRLRPRLQGARGRFPGGRGRDAQRRGGQRARAGRRQFAWLGGDVEADADHDRVAGRLGEDPGELRGAGQHVVRPFEPRLDSGHGGHRRGDGHPGEQREPAAAGGRHRGRPHQQGERQRGVRRRYPGAAHPAASRALLLGGQHQAFRRAAEGPGQQVGVGRAGAVYDLHGLPQPARPQDGAGQAAASSGFAGDAGVSGLPRRMVLGSHGTHYCSVAGRREIVDRSRNEPAPQRGRRRARADRGPDDGSAPERQRSWQLWPPEISWDPGPRPRGSGPPRPA